MKRAGPSGWVIRLSVTAALVTYLAPAASAGGKWGNANPAPVAGAINNSPLDRRLAITWPNRPTAEPKSASLDKHMKKARQALEEGNLYVACQSAQSAGRTGDRSGRPAIDGLLAQIDRKAQDSLSQADKLYLSGEHSAAMREYQRLALLTPLPTAAQAAGRIRSAQKDPGYRAVILEERAANMHRLVLTIIQRQRQTLERAEPVAAPSGAPEPTTQPARAGRSDADVVATLPLEQQAQVMTLLRTIGSGFPETPTWERMRPLLIELAHDDRIDENIRRWGQHQQLRGKLELARNYAWNGRCDRASECYRQVIAEHPGSNYADYAQQALRQLPPAQ